MRETVSRQFSPHESLRETCRVMTLRQTLDKGDPGGSSTYGPLEISRSFLPCPSLCLPLDIQCIFDAESGSFGGKTNMKRDALRATDSWWCVWCVLLATWIWCALLFTQLKDFCKWETIFFFHHFFFALFLFSEVCVAKQLLWVNFFFKNFFLRWKNVSFVLFCSSEPSQSIFMFLSPENAKHFFAFSLLAFGEDQTVKHLENQNWGS